VDSLAIWWVAFQAGAFPTGTVPSSTSDATYFRQDQQLLELVRTQPPDRVSYRHLTSTDEDMRAIMKYALEAGILEREIDISKLLDLRFIPSTISPAQSDSK